MTLTRSKSAHGDAKKARCEWNQTQLEKSIPAALK